MWKEIQSYGNPDKIKWTSSDSEKIKSINNIRYMEELKKYIDFEPFFLTPSYPEDHFYSDLF